jgi:hypothetical protein
MLLARADGDRGGDFCCPFAGALGKNPRRDAPMLRHCVFDSLHWASPDNLSGWLPDYEPLLTLDYHGVREFVLPGPKVAGVPCTSAVG